MATLSIKDSSRERQSFNARVLVLFSLATALILVLLTGCVAIVSGDLRNRCGGRPDCQNTLVGIHQRNGYLAFWGGRSLRLPVLSCRSLPLFSARLRCRRRSYAERGRSAIPHKCCSALHDCAMIRSCSAFSSAL